MSQKINGQLEVIFRLIDAESSDNKAFIQSEFSIIDLANSFIHKNNSFNPEVSTPIFKTNLDVQLIIILLNQIEPN